MVQRVMGYPAGDPLYGGAVQILQDNYNAHVAARATATIRQTRMTTRDMTLLLFRVADGIVPLAARRGNLKAVISEQ